MLGRKIGAGSRSSRTTTATLPPIPSYAAELNQVWTNLIDNAVQAMDGDGHADAHAPAADGDSLLVEIADTGPGIPDDVQDRIFEPFFTTKPVGQGTGLGLDISWRIVVNKHHGDLEVTSEPGDTRFSVRLPVDAARRSEETRHERASTATPGIDPSVPPSGTGCVECDAHAAAGGSTCGAAPRAATSAAATRSPSQHATAHAAATGHRVMQSFEPGEDWFWDYDDRRRTRRARARAPDRPPRRPARARPGGRVPDDWMQHIR